MASRRRYKQSAAPVENVAVVSPELPPEQPAPADDDALVRAAQAAHHAEELQRQHHDAHAQHHAAIDQIPGLNDHKRNMLKQYPQMLHHGEAIRQHYANAINAGIPDDSPQMDSHLVQALHHEIAKSGGVPQQPLPMAQPPTPQRRSIPVSAPVSRDPWMASGHRQAASGKITLSKDEVEIAHNSRADLPPLEAEKLYVQGKKLMLARKAAGTYESK
jgi:hypothetical protein